jgi:hypothetical chaperone protein
MIYGLDFGTTNSSISVFKDGRSILLPIDVDAVAESVLRSALYFYPKKMVISNKVNKQQLESHTFYAHQISYEGETKTLIGQRAVVAYLNDNKSRHPGVKRKIYTGKIHNMILYVTPSGKQVTGDIPDYYEEIDYGTGRLFHALKTALKSEVYKGNTIFGTPYTLEQLIGLLVGQIKTRADIITGEVADTVVCGRPVYFSTDKEKDLASQIRLENSIKEAGFKNVTFEFEPVAAAKYYLSTHPGKSQKILVFDFGGGTFDTTIMDSINGFNVLATDGVYIGGDLLNSDIFYHKLGKYFGTEVTFGERGISLPGHIINALRSWYGIPNLNNPNDIGLLTGDIRYKNSDIDAIERLLYLIQKNLGFEIYEAIEVAKKQLTKNDSAKIYFKDGPIDINIEITKLEFEKIIEPRVSAVKKCVEDTLSKANLKSDDIDVVVRTGGSSLIPVFENMLYDLFGHDKVTEFDPFTSVAAGLSVPEPKLY